MRGQRKCGTCNWFDDKSEDFKARYVSADGLCCWKMPAVVAKNCDGWGDWHQKSPAAVRKDDWCSCWLASPEFRLSTEPQRAIEAPTPLALTGG